MQKPDRLTIGSHKKSHHQWARFAGTTGGRSGREDACDHFGQVADRMPGGDAPDGPDNYRRLLERVEGRLAELPAPQRPVLFRTKPRGRQVPEDSVVAFHGDRRHIAAELLAGGRVDQIKQLGLLGDPANRVGQTKSLTQPGRGIVPIGVLDTLAPSCLLGHD